MPWPHPVPVPWVVGLAVKEVVVVTPARVPVVTPRRVEPLAGAPVVVGQRSGGLGFGIMGQADAGEAQACRESSRGSGPSRSYCPNPGPTTDRGTSGSPAWVPKA